MIIIFEPQCIGFGHEQFNAGFLYGYLLAYPEEHIVFWGEKEHINCIKSIFISANMPLNNVEFIEAEVPEANKLSKPGIIVEYYRIFNELLHYASENHCDKVVLLSIYAYNLIPLKLLILLLYKDTFRFHIMMHGALEFIKRSNISFPIGLPIALFNGLRKFLNLTVIDFKIKPRNKYLYEKLFKSSLQLFGNKNITYYVFREDSLENLKKYLPDAQKFFKSIDLPYVYKDMLENNEVVSSNRKVFATIGQGDIIAVRKTIRRINGDTNGGANNFEIRIINGNKIKQDDLEPIKYIVDGQILSRAKIEEQIRDVQFVLFFYDEDFYELTTSGAFFDAIAYCKPMIFLKNRCLDYYYQSYKFGYRCEDINEMTAVMRKIMIGDDEHYPEFCSEIRRMQNDVSIRRNYYKLKIDKGNTCEY